MAGRYPTIVVESERRYYDSKRFDEHAARRIQEMQQPAYQGQLEQPTDDPNAGFVLRLPAEETAGPPVFRAPPAPPTFAAPSLIAEDASTAPPERAQPAPWDDPNLPDTERFALYAASVGADPNAAATTEPQSRSEETAEQVRLFDEHARGLGFEGDGNGAYRWSRDRAGVEPTYPTDHGLSALGGDPSKGDPLAVLKLTTSQGGEATVPEDERRLLEDYPSPDAQMPGTNRLPLLTPAGMIMPPPLPVTPAAPKPPSQDEQDRWREGKGPKPDPLLAKLGVTDFDPALTAGVGGLSRLVGKQLESGIGAAEGSPGVGFRHLDASDAAMGRRAFAQGAIEGSGPAGDGLVSAARGAGDVVGAGGAMGAQPRRLPEGWEVIRDRTPEGESYTLSMPGGVETRGFSTLDDLHDFARRLEGAEPPARPIAAVPAVGDEVAPAVDDAARGTTPRAADPPAEPVEVPPAAANEPVEPSPPSRVPTVRALEDALSTGHQTATIPLSRRIEVARATVVRAITDRQVDLAEFQHRAQRNVGRDLTPDEMALELSRLNPDRAAEVVVQEGLRPILRGVGADRGKLSVLLRLEDTIATGKHGADGVSPAAARKALADLEAELGPERMATLRANADRARSFAEQLEQRRLDAGLPPRDPKAPLLRDVDEPKPTDPLTYLMRRAYQVEEDARKNETIGAFARLAEFSPDLGTTVRKVTHSYRPAEGERVVKGYVEGEIRYYAMPKELANTIDEEARGAAIPGLPTLMGVVRAMLTSRNPAFVVQNSVLDAINYAGRTASREGGNPRRYPGIVADLAVAYVDAFKGLLSGTIEGEASKRYLKGGGGQFGFVGSEQSARATLNDLARANVLEVKSAADLKRIVGDLLTLKTVESVGERVELAPRVAAMRRAERQGKSAAEAVVAGRSVTLDFAQAGTLVRQLNGFSLFLNAGVQGAMVPARAFKENPRGFAATMATMLVAPVVAAEAWNRSDEQRARDYDDLPDGIKDSGVVLMLPGEAPIVKGERKPQFIHIRTREWSPYVVWTREVAARAMGDDPRSWEELAGATVRGMSPVAGENTADLVTGLAPPVSGTAGQLAYDYDAFRGKPIATDKNDANAKPISRTLADGITAAMRAVGLDGEVRPSQVDFFIRDTTGGVGQMVMAGDELRRDGPKNSGRPQDVPLLGGIIRRFVRDDTGGRLERAIENKLTDEARAVLEAVGIRYEPATVKPEAWNTQLTRDQWAAYQQSVNDRADVAILALAQTDPWKVAATADREKMLRTAVAEARRQGEEATAALLGITPTPQATTTRTAGRSPTPTPDLAAGYVKQSPTPTSEPTPRPSPSSAASRPTASRAAPTATRADVDPERSAGARRAAETRRRNATATAVAKH